MQIDLAWYVSLPLCSIAPSPQCQLSGVAEGLHFLHSRNIVHGNLKGVRDSPKTCFAAVLTCVQSNILVDDAGRPRITDFSQTTLIQNSGSAQVAFDDQGHTARWTAPEILTEQGTYSKESDVFSFAMVTVEVRCGILLPIFGLLTFCTNTGVHRRNSIPR